MIPQCHITQNITGRVLRELQSTPETWSKPAQQLNATESESIKASEDPYPTANKTAKDDFFSCTENASDSANSSEQPIEIDSTPGSGAVEVRHENDMARNSRHAILRKRRRSKYGE